MKLFSDAIGSGVIKVLGLILSYVMFITLARTMSDVEFGRFSFTYSIIFLFTAIFTLGFDSSILRFRPQYLVQNQKHFRRGFLLAGLRVVLLVSLIGCLVINSYISWMPSWMQPKNSELIQLASFIAIGHALMSYVCAGLRSDRRILVATLPEDILIRLALPVGAVALSRFSQDVSAEALLVVYLGIIVANILYQLFAIVYDDGHLTLTERPKSSYDWRKWFKVSLPLWGVGIVNVASLHFDTVIVGFFLAPEATGGFFIAIKIAALVGIAFFVAAVILGPVFSEAYHSSNSAEMDRVCKFSALGLFFPTLTALIIVIVLGEFAISLVNENFLWAYPILLIQCFTVAIVTIFGGTSALLQVTGYEKQFFRAFACCYLLIILSQLVLLPMLGAYGAVIPTLIGMTTLYLWSWIYTRRTLGVDPTILRYVFPMPRTVAATA